MPDRVATFSFRLKAMHPRSVVEKLAAIPRRGKEPESSSEWLALYNAIRSYLDAGKEN